MREREDAFGRALLDQLERGNARVVVERDDGYVETETVAWYFGEFRNWHACERQALRYVRGRVLDLGAGAGRVALELEKRGLDVVAVDISPLAIDVCRKRGVRDARLLRLTQIDASLGSFDTIGLFGNNFGLFENPRRARWLLRRLRGITTADGRMIAVSYDPSQAGDPDSLAYQERNLRRGRHAGQVRLRVRYKDLTTPWVDYLMVSPAEMEEIFAGTGWNMDRLFRDDGIYAAVLTRS